MLARVARVGQENPCRAGPAYLCSRQLLRPGQGHQLDRVAMGGAWAGLWVAVSPHKGHKPASSQLQGNPGQPVEARRKPWPASSQSVGNAGQVVGLGGALGLVSYQPQADP